MMSMMHMRTTADGWLPRVAWLVWAINVLLWAAMMALIFLPRSIHSPVSFVLQRVSTSTYILSAASVGAVVAWRRPRNPIGWLLSAAAFSWIGVAFSAEYALYGLVESPNALPAGELGFLVGQTFHVPGGVILVYAMLLFPTGRFLAPRWALVGWSNVIGQVLWYAGILLTPGPIQTAMYSFPENPFGVDLPPALLAHGLSGFVLFVVSTALAAASLVVRFRHAVGVERQQIKWLAFGAVCAVICVTPWSVIVVFRITPALHIAQEVLPALTIFAVSLLPVAVSIALLRYRLYDIDVIINRTLVYGVVTAVLAGTFAALSVAAQRLALGITGQESQAAVVLAALVVTAMFQPLRGRVQALVDRRFYRSKYDASRTLERFASRVRDEMELDLLARSLVSVVQETMRPAHASLWLRPRSDTPVGQRAERME